MPQSFRWCFIGTGKLANQVAKELQEKGGHEIVSVYSRRYEKAREFAEKFGGTAYDDIVKAMSADGVQAVYVVTPHSAHYDNVKQAIELGKPVLCEKPFMTDAVKARELFALAKERGVYVTEAMWTWFSPVANQVKKWLDEGEFGEIEHVFVNYHLDVRSYAPRLTDPEKAGGMLLDSGVYPITYLYRLFGKPTGIVCSGEIRNGVDMREEVDLTFADGRTIRSSISMLDFKGLEYILIEGTKARIKLRFFHSAKKVKLVRRKGRNVTFTGEETSFKNEFDLAAAEILAGKTESSYVPPESTVAVLDIMDECRRQMGLVYPFEQEAVSPH